MLKYPSILKVGLLSPWWNLPPMHVHLRPRSRAAVDGGCLSSSLIIPLAFSEPGHLAQVTDRSCIFWLPNSSSSTVFIQNIIWTEVLQDLKKKKKSVFSFYIAFTDSWKHSINAFLKPLETIWIIFHLIKLRLNGKSSMCASQLSRAAYFCLVAVKMNWLFLFGTADRRRMWKKE